MAEKEKFFIVGCGDIGRRVARLIQVEGGEVTALVRSPEKGSQLVELGIRSVTGNLDDAATLVGLPVAGAVVFYLAPPPGGGHLDTRARNFCAAVPAGGEPRRIVYISTSGVYGDCGGRVVTEETPPDPQTPRGKRRLDAENVFLEWGREHGTGVVILRVSGIYGPGRLPLQHLAGGQPVLREEEATLTNRIHSDDLARVCVAAAERGEDGDVFNVSDGHPGTLTEYFVKAARILGLPEPRRVTREEAREVMSPLMLSYIGEERILDNTKMLRELGVTLLYPTLDDGLPACLPKEGRA
jgi:nucleoside-diphosphate-sugar epimerase